MKKNPTKVMLVDDDELISELMVIVLESDGYEVEHHGSGESALDAVVDSKPDLVLLDMIMPGMNGVETLQSMRLLPETDQIRVIFMSGVSDNDQIEGMMANDNVLGLIQKPIDTSMIGDQIMALWNQA